MSGSWDDFDLRAVAKPEHLYAKMRETGSPPPTEKIKQAWDDLSPKQRRMHHTCAFAWGWEDDWGILIEESRELLGLSRIEMIAFFVFVEVNKLRNFTDTVSVQSVNKEPWE